MGTHSLECQVTSKYSSSPCYHKIIYLDIRIRIFGAWLHMSVQGGFHFLALIQYCRISQASTEERFRSHIVAFQRLRLGKNKTIYRAHQKYFDPSGISGKHIVGPSPPSLREGRRIRRLKGKLYSGCHPRTCFRAPCTQKHWTCVIVS